MSSVSSSSPPSAKPAFDLDYSIHDFEVDPHADSQFLYRRVEETMLAEGAVRGGRTLDVACGTAKIPVEIKRRGGEGWGLEPSLEMVGIGRWLFPEGGAVMVRGVAEALPFRDGSFDRILCQGALDHFVSPQAFMREAARALRPNGRLIVALANYESLSCKLGRRLRWVAHRVSRRPPSPDRPYWEIPPDHYHKGDLPFVRRLGGASLRLERCYGISLLWLSHGWGGWSWGNTLDRLPNRLARLILAALDRIAYRAPGLADMIVSVWRPTGTRMTHAPPQTAEFELEYAIEEDIPPGRPNRDSQFVFKRMPELITEKATEGTPGRVLDVGCGFGAQMDLLRARSWEAWGLDASFDLARYCRHRFAGDNTAPVVCATAEALPFRDQSFQSVVCQGSLDHFARPRSFMRELARVLKPDGRVVIAISNYDSLSCQLGHGLYRLKERFGQPVFQGRNYWEIPRNHTFRATYSALCRLGGPHLELLECRGISLLWLFHRWTRLMETLPRPLAWSTMTVLDRIAYRLPAIADVVVSVWRPRRNVDGRR